MFLRLMKWLYVRKKVDFKLPKNKNLKRRDIFSWRKLSLCEKNNLTHDIIFAHKMYVVYKFVFYSTNKYVSQSNCRYIDSSTYYFWKL